MLEPAETTAIPATAPLRLITATSLFDGHDAAIGVMRRILQAHGVEVIHLGHHRTVAEVVTAAWQEDAHGIAISSYQGGHVEYLQYMLDQLRAHGGDNIRVFAGGGGVIIPSEQTQLEQYGVTRIYTPADGQQLGLDGIIEDIIARSQFDPAAAAPTSLQPIIAGDRRALAQALSAVENATAPATLVQELAQFMGGGEAGAKCPVLGITGTGGAGKSSLTDELLLRFRRDFGDALKIAILAVDPTRRKSRGALLGDRIRMNAINHPNIFMRSLATRQSASEVPAYLPQMLALCRAAQFNLIMVETPGIGQGNTAITTLADCTLYVMTPEFGAPSQLEKIDMLDFADAVAINKFDRQGAEDAYREVCKQVQRNRQLFTTEPTQMPVFGTIAARFNDDGMTALFQGLVAQLQAHGLTPAPRGLATVATRVSTQQHPIIPLTRTRYLAEIAGTVTAYHLTARKQAQLARAVQQLQASWAMLAEVTDVAQSQAALQALIEQKQAQLAPDLARQLAEWPDLKARYAEDEFTFTVRGQAVTTPLKKPTLSGSFIPRVAIPPYEDHGELARWLLAEHLPGYFPFTAGVFPFKRAGEPPTRMFAGEGDAFKTNRRFKKLSAHATAKRLSTAFDSVTLYGCDPDSRPDIYGKVGNSGVSIATIEDMHALYDGFDLCDPTTSVSMTINGPAPIILAMFLNTAIAQQYQAAVQGNELGHEQGHELDDETRRDLRAKALATVRGTVQADILKEDQGQNTCIFSTEFALKLMGDIQQYFIDHHIANFYSVSISGYHIAEAGANPITQLAFTLANGFTYVEAYLARGMAIDDFAANLSFFFSNGMCPEYSVMGRVARRIWAITMRERYGANTRAQKLKYHIQTSGRSLHAQELDFNDIRTTLQALIAIYDHCNSLHTNAYDEAITTPTDASVRRALAIQLIINEEWGLALNENPNQGSFIITELTDLLEEAVLLEFARLSARGGVLGAMETGYQRARIQEESMLYERRKHDASLPIIGVNTFLAPEVPKTADAPPVADTIPLSRSSEAEKQNQIKRLRTFHTTHRDAAGPALARVKHAAMQGENVFAELMAAVQYCSLGQLAEALYEVGGQYRRSM